MWIDYIHFYVKNAVKTRNWFIEKIGFKHYSQGQNHHTHTEIVTNNCSIFFVISSPRNPSSPVSNYLNSQPSGVVDVAFRVDNIDSIINQSYSQNMTIINSPQTHYLEQGKIKFAKIKGWNSLHHTLIENTTKIPFCQLLSQLKGKIDIPVNEIENCFSNQNQLLLNNCDTITDIDHVVLNVSNGELAKAVEFYQTIFNFKVRQNFEIKTNNSGLYSQALIAPQNGFYFNINEPTSTNSQIQEFIDINKGSGIQHLAIKSTNIIKSVRQMRHRGLSFLHMSKIYYSKLKQEGRNGLIPSLTTQQWKAIEREEILVDCDPNLPESLLMQIFTKPIFNEPTFFLEFIERRKQAQGFGEGNFQALFELIETEQIKRN
jgi:4-hydroxyphenylpyruvate dioxygenase